MIRVLVLPPKLAPFEVVVVPIHRGDQSMQVIRKYYTENLELKFKKAGLKVHVDWRDSYKPGFKFAHWEMRGIPLRINIGERDIAQGQVELVRRDTNEKMAISIDTLTETLQKLKEDIQKQLFTKALNFREENTHKVDTYDDFKDVLNSKNGAKSSNFILAHWDGTTETELKN